MQVCKDGSCITPIKLGYIDIEIGAAVLTNKATSGQIIFEYAFF